MSAGYKHIFCGDGVGKTAAAFGKGVQKASQGKSVVLIQFLKERKDSDRADYYKRLEPELKLFRFEKFPENYESLTQQEQQEEMLNIKNGLNFAKKVLTTGGCDVLILDEILGLTEKEIVTVDELKMIIDMVGDDMELYLTGNVRCQELWPYVDEVTELVCAHHAVDISKPE